MAQVLYLKWRPSTWAEVIGQEHVITTLKNAVKHDRVSHAQLFSGPRGTGKTSTARLLAKAVNCLAEDLADRPCNQCQHCQAVNRGEFLDLIEIDAASNTSVDDVRDLREKINFSPNQGRYKVYIIDEVHMLSKPAFNALLKTLEEPPDHALFVLATTEAHKIPTTVVSRCQRHDFRRIPVPEIVQQLQEMADVEGLAVEDSVLSLIARQATGSLRDAISILDQLSSAEEKITLKLAHHVLGTSTNQAVLDLTGALIDGDASQGLSTLAESAERGTDPRQFNRQIIAYFRNMLLFKMGNPERVDLPRETLSVIKGHAASLTVEQILALIRIFNMAVNDRGGSWLPILPLEMAFIEGLGILGGAEQRGHKPPIQDPPAPENQLVPEQSPNLEDTPPLTSPQQKSSGTNLEPDPPAVLKQWKVIIDQVSQESPAIHALLRSCIPLGIKEGALILSFRDETIKTKMEKGDHLQVCQTVMENVLGIRLPIQCVIRVTDGQGLPEDVDPEGLVATAVQDLGGRYVRDQAD